MDLEVTSQSGDIKQQIPCTRLFPGVTMEPPGFSQSTRDAFDSLTKLFLSLDDAAKRWSCFFQFRRDPKLYACLSKLLDSTEFKCFMKIIIYTNAIILAVEADYFSRMRQNTFFTVMDAFFLAVYFTELLMNLCVDPIGYGGSSYYILDMTILISCFCLYLEPLNADIKDIIGSVYSFRILKVVKYSEEMKSLLKSVGQALHRTMYTLLLLLFLIFVFAILGHDLYGDPVTGDTANWFEFSSALFSVFTLVTVECWTELQRSAESHGFAHTSWFMITVIFLGNFIFLNLFITLVIEYKEHFTQEIESRDRAMREAAIQAKKQELLKKQREDKMKAAFCQTCSSPHQDNTESEKFSELLEDIKKVLCRSNNIVTEEFCSDTPFTDLYQMALNTQENEMERFRLLYLELSDTLREMRKKSLPHKVKTKS